MGKGGWWSFLFMSKIMLEVGWRAGHLDQVILLLLFYWVYSDISKHLDNYYREWFVFLFINSRIPQLFKKLAAFLRIQEKFIRVVFNIRIYLIIVWKVVICKTENGLEFVCKKNRYILRHFWEKNRFGLYVDSGI